MDLAGIERMRRFIPSIVFGVCLSLVPLSSAHAGKWWKFGKSKSEKKEETSHSSHPSEKITIKVESPESEPLKSHDKSEKREEARPSESAPKPFKSSYGMGEGK